MKVKVNETQSQEVDWSKNPQLVVSGNGTVVMTMIRQIDDGKGEFIGMVVLAGESSADILGYYDTTFYRKSFKPFHGSITLQND